MQTHYNVRILPGNFFNTTFKQLLVSKLNLSFLVALLLVCLTYSGAFATTYTFTNTVNNNWTTSGNWSPSYPGVIIFAGDEVVIAASSNCVLPVGLTNNGTLINNGTLNNQPGSTLTNSSGSILNNDGELANGGILRINGSTLNNNSGGILNNFGGTLTINTNGVLNNNSGGALTNNLTGTLNNNWVIYSGGTLTNDGTLNNNSAGELVLNTIGASIPGGTFNWNSGGTLTIGSSGVMTLTNSLTVPIGTTLKVLGTLNIDAGSTVTNNGTLTNNSGGELVLNINGASIPGGAFNWNSGSTLTIGTSGVMTLTNSLTVPIGTTLKVLGTLNIDAASTLTNNGNLTINSGTLNINTNCWLSNYGTVTNTGNVTNDWIISNYSGGILNNTGTLISNGTFGNNDGSTLNNNSTLTTNGTLVNNSGATLNNNSTGTINGSGTINQNGGSYTGASFGAIAPGNSTGTLSVTGNLDLDSNTYESDIDGAVPTNDVLALTGEATLTNATLEVTWLNNPTVAGTYTVMTFGSRIGEFATVTIPTVTGFTFSIEYTATTVSIQALVVLPIELLYIRGEAIDQSNKITWASASEENSSHFEVERSSDGATFEMIGIVAANGNTVINQSYSLLDEKPLQGIVYYRLKMVDLDDTFEYSNIVSISFNKNNKEIQLAISPNPATDVVHFAIAKDEINNAIIEIHSITGQLIFQKRVNKNDPNPRFDWNTEGAVKGIYIATLMSGSERKMEKIIIQ